MKIKTVIMGIIIKNNSNTYHNNKINKNTVHTKCSNLTDVK